MAVPFVVRVPFRNAGSFALGTVIDYWTFTYVSGPTSLPSITVPATSNYLQYSVPSNLPGSYIISGQAYAPGGGTVGSAIQVSFVVNDAIGTAPAYLPVSLKFVGNPGGSGSGQLSVQLMYQNLGQLAPGQTIKNAIISLTGPSIATATILPAQTTATFTGIVNGNYAYSIQSYDNSSVAFGPAMNSGPGGIPYFDDALTTGPLLLPQSPATSFTVPLFYANTPTL